MKTLSKIDIGQVNGGQGLSQYHIDEIRTSNWPTPFNSNLSGQNGERLSWHLASIRQFDYYANSSVR